MRGELIPNDQVENAKVVYLAIRKQFKNHSDTANFIGLSRGVLSKLIYENKCSHKTRVALLQAFRKRSDAIYAADRANSCKAMARAISAILGA